MTIDVLDELRFSPIGKFRRRHWQTQHPRDTRQNARCPTLRTMFPVIRRHNMHRIGHSTIRTSPFRSDGSRRRIIPGRLSQACARLDLSRPVQHPGRSGAGTRRKTAAAPSPWRVRGPRRDRPIRPPRRGSGRRAGAGPDARIPSAARPFPAPPMPRGNGSAPVPRPRRPGRRHRAPAPAPPPDALHPRARRDTSAHPDATPARDGTRRERR